MVRAKSLIDQLAGPYRLTRHAARYLLALLLVGWVLTLSAQATLPTEAARPALVQPLTVRWRYASDATINLTPAIRNERVYVPLAGGELVALDAANGSLLWKNDNGGEISCAPEADETAVYVASATGELSAAHNLPEITPKAYVRAVNRTTGLTLWTRTLPTALYGLLVANEQAVFGVSANGAVYALAKNSGEILWTVNPAPSLSSDLTLHGTRLYVGSKEGLLFALETTTGRVAWQYQMRGGVRGRIWPVGNIIYAASDNGQVVALNEADGVLRWQTQAGPRTQALAASEGALYLASFDNSLYVLDLAKGKRLWRKQLSSRVASTPLATTEGVLLTSMAGNIATVLHPRDGKILNTLTLDDDGSTAATPVLASGIVLITGRKGLLAFANPAK